MTSWQNNYFSPQLQITEVSRIKQWISESVTQILFLGFLIWLNMTLSHSIYNYTAHIGHIYYNFIPKNNIIFSDKIKFNLTELS